MRAQMRVRGEAVTLLGWLRRHDPGLAATRRAGRTAIVMPALFALCIEVLHSATMASFAAFGSFSMLLMVEYTGPMVQRLRAHLGLAVAWGVLICLGTVAARVTWVAVVGTLIVAFLVLFSGVVSSVLAGSSTALLMAFVLPVADPVPFSQIPDRLAGAGMAAGAAMLAITLLWPRASTDLLSAPAALVCRTAAIQLRCDAARLARDADAPSAKRCQETSADATKAARALNKAFHGTPYRPTGLSASSRALVRLVDELTWLSAIVAESMPRPDDTQVKMDDAGVADAVPLCDPEAHAVRRAVAHVLDCAADLLDKPHSPLEPLRVASRRLGEAMDLMVRGSTSRLPLDRPVGSSDEEVRGFLSTLDVSFRAQELGFATQQVAGNVLLVAEAEQRTWWSRVLGREPGALGKPLDSARERAAAHLEPHSVWLHNSLRGAVGLAIAVTIADLTDAQHSFWVLLGTLSVLRSNALNTGQNALRAVGGTVVGSIIGAALLELIGHHGNVLWVLLPIAILLAGIAPAAISFEAGQAAFTVTLLILFNIGVNPDWHIAVLRIHDIALGCGVSLVVALFFWPRGAAAAVDKALAEAYEESAAYLGGAIEYALSRVGEVGSTIEPPVHEGRQAAAAARRLDDAFRSYLAERGVKRVPLADMATLVTGVVGLRLAADAVLAIWRTADDGRLDADGASARRELLGAAGVVTAWYRELALGLDRRTPAAPEPLLRSPDSAARLLESVRADLHDEDGQATANAVRLIWTGDHVDAARRLQPSLAAAVGALGGV
jgi:Fusaric acid resistance protein-like